MTFRVVRGAVAETEIDEFARYAADYSEDFARAQFAASIASSQSTSQKLPTRGAIFTSPARHTARTCFVWGGERVIGSSIPSVTTQRSSTCCAFGTRAESRSLLKSEKHKLF